MLTCKVGKKIINTFSFNEVDLRKWSNQKILRCPVCNERMIYCNGEFKNSYFKHEKNSDCSDIYSEGITQEHIQGIKIIYEWLKKQDGITNIQLEKWIEKTHQRPDIYFQYNNEEYVIEYQCSPISTQYSKRHELYQLQGINDIWILGISKYFEYNFNYIEKNVNKNILFEKKLKTIESEILNEGNNLIYLNSNNERFYITNKELTKNATRTKIGYYSGNSYEEKLKTIYCYDLKSIHSDNIALNKIICTDIKDVKDDYIKFIIDSEINVIRNIIINDINLDIIQEIKNKNEYRIVYKDLNDKEYIITYDYINNEILGFKYKNHNINLYFNYNNTLCATNEYKMFKYLIDDYFMEENEIKFKEDIERDFNSKKQLAIKNNEDKICTQLNYLFNIYQSYIHDTYKYIDNISLRFFKRAERYVEITITYGNYKKSFEYEIDDICVNSIFKEIELFIKDKLDKEKNNIKIIYDLKEHYEYNLCDDFKAMYIECKEIENDYKYIITIDFNYYDEFEIQLYKNKILINDEIYYCDDDNKRKRLMTIISNEFRKRKYKTKGDK